MTHRTALDRCFHRSRAGACSFGELTDQHEPLDSTFQCNWKPHSSLAPTENGRTMTEVRCCTSEPARPGGRSTDGLRALADDVAFDLVHQRVETPEAAERWSFRGSPTVLVDGRDVFAVGGEPVGLSCRIILWLLRLHP